MMAVGPDWNAELCLVARLRPIPDPMARVNIPDGKNEALVQFARRVSRFGLTRCIDLAMLYALI
jgi:hypothetical protein